MPMRRFAYCLFGICISMFLLFHGLCFANEIHVLAADNNGNYRVVIHTAMPAGNNSAGVSWKECWLESNKSILEDGTISSVTSRLIEGTAPGNISTAELADVKAGDVIELSGTIKLETGGASPISLAEMVQALIDDVKAVMQVKLKFFGYIQD